jgi:DNA-binding Xre family transcriptional regulator
MNTASPPTLTTETPQKLRNLRLTQGLSLQEVATRAGTTKSQIDKLEKGERRLTLDWLTRLGEALGFNVADLLATEVGGAASLHEPGASFHYSLAPLPPLPVQGKIDNLTGQLTHLNKVTGSVARPPQLAGVSDAFAVLVAGDGLAPRCFAGNVLYVHPGKALTLGCLVVVGLENGQALLAELVERNAEGLKVLVSRADTALFVPIAQVRLVGRVVMVAEET